MRKRVPKYLQAVLLAAIGCAFLYPLFCNLALSWFSIPQPTRLRLLNQSLNNVSRGTPPPAPTAAAIWSGSWQKACGESLNCDFAGRELLIRWTNEAYYRALRQSPMIGPRIVLGNDDLIFDQGYLDNWAYQRFRSEQLRPVVVKLRKFQDKLMERGIGFVFMITPSKARIYSEGVPAPWANHRRPEPHGYEVLRPLLDEYGIQYVDGVRITEEAKRESPVPVFPKGGIHWGDYPVWKTGSAVIDRFRSQGKDVPEWRVTSLKQLDVPEMGVDQDLLALMNLAFPWSYPVHHVNLQAVDPQKGKTRTLFVVGGSFASGLTAKLTASSIFSEVHFYSYYNLGRFIFSAPSPSWFSLSGTGNLRAAMLGADCCLLEMNESVIGVNQHISSFMAAAIPLIKESKGRSFRFPFETYASYGIGEEVSFTLDGLSESMRHATSGFGVPEQRFTWTTEPVACLRLIPSSAKGSLRLSARLRAFLYKGLSQQTVKVSAEGQEIAVWSVRGAASEFTADIPANLLEHGSLTLSFSIPNATRPADKGVSPDMRQLGVAFQSLRLDSQETLSSR